MTMTRRDLDWAWFAGVFEGEGCITWGSKSNPRVVISMTDADTIQRIFAIAGVGNTYTYSPPSFKNRKPLFSWATGRRRDVEHVLNRIRPYLSERRLARAREALIHYQANMTRSRRQTLSETERPRCGCHGLPQWSKGIIGGRQYWECCVKRQALDTPVDSSSVSVP